MALIRCLGETHGDRFSAYWGDCVDVLSQMPEASIDFSCYSPPFGSLFVYSASSADMGNSTDDEFAEHYAFLVKEKFRVTKPGRLTAVHCSDLPMTKWKDGAVGIKDFSGDIIRAHEDAGWVFHSRRTIWKSPVTEMARTKHVGLLYKQLRSDSSKSRGGMPDYLLTFIKPGQNESPITHTPEDFPLPQWQEWASPVWMTIDQSNVLNVRIARDAADEKHLCLARDSRVLTKERGYVAIQDVAPGENVLTHKGRWRPVLAAQNTGVRSAVTVSGHGVPGLTLTPDHKLWARNSDWKREREGAEQADPEWLESKKTLGAYVNLKLPETEISLVADDHLWWIVGRWIADGHWDGRGSPHISCGKHELDDLIDRLGERAGAYFPGTAFQVRILDRDGAIKKILHRCGHGAAGKHLPSEAFTLPIDQARALLDGYLSGDGHLLEDRQRWMASSVSRDLLLGLALLAQRAYGAIASVYAGRPEREAVIQGRTVQCKQDWIMSFDIPDDDRRQKPFILDDGAWKKIRNIADAGDVETWNLRVEEDESYTAEGCIVKNCPLQLDVIERALVMWSNQNDVVLSPFMGIGSEGVVSLKLKRRFIGVELKEAYWKRASLNMDAEDRQSTISLFAAE